MGVWFFATAFGNYLAGMSAALFESWSGLKIFSFVTVITFTAGIILYILSPTFEKMMILDEKEELAV